ncbi:MFS transporter [Halomonas rhizosphaerae]|uniref:MFS transporter n=1 Tax=Halomonas rhizosphaerae TaxID=3043296 RepID=A0ABT6V136_9GAMM|nr:MFS transporter [Halomonas rhizosphaerae]MDI5891938.1 MFS transporter [Halomonas rhizosphaerae]
MTPDPAQERYTHGIRENLHQFSHQLGQVFLVGLTIGMMRTVVPALAESAFGVAEGSFMMLTSFVVAFGFVKGTLNFGGLGMALLYPNLSAAVADISHPNWRSSAIGIYRFWRDLGYGIGALGFGLVAHLSGAVTGGFWFVAIAMFLSGALVMLWGEETHPRLNPAPHHDRKDRPPSPGGSPMSERPNEDRPKATPELAALIHDFMDPGSTTLRQVRELLMGDDLMVSDGGEIMYPQDRKWLVNELDELIDRHGLDAPAKEVLGD